MDIRVAQPLGSILAFGRTREGFLILSFHQIGLDKGFAEVCIIDRCRPFFRLHFQHAFQRLVRIAQCQIHIAQFAVRLSDAGWFTVLLRQYAFPF